MKSNVIILLTNAAMTGTSTVNSQAVATDQLWGYAVQAVWTGTPNGTLELQASCDSPNGLNTSEGSFSPTNWTVIANSSDMISGSAGNYMWNVSDVAYRYVRLSYTNTSSTGSLSATLCAKGI